MRYLLMIAFIIVGIIHILPLLGVVSNERLQQLYGISISDVNLAILLLHRAVLFGIIGIFLCVAAFRQELQIAALCIGFISVLSFLLLAWSIGGYNPQVERVVFADIVALVCLVIASIAWYFGQQQRPQ